MIHYSAALNYRHSHAIRHLFSRTGWIGDDVAKLGRGFLDVSVMQLLFAALTFRNQLFLKLEIRGGFYW